MYACVFRYRRTTCSGWISCPCHKGVHGVHFTSVLKREGGALLFCVRARVLFSWMFFFFCCCWNFVSGLAFQKQKATRIKTTLDTGRNFLRGGNKERTEKIYFTFHTSHTCTEPRDSYRNIDIPDRHHKVSWCPLYNSFLKGHLL